MSDLEKMNGGMDEESVKSCNHECGACPDCDTCDEFDDENLIILSDEDGEQVVFELLDTIEYEGEYYIVLYPVEEDEAEDVIILHVHMDENEEEVYDSVPDELVLTLFEIFKERNKDLFVD